MVTKLREVMARLRNPDGGCPWDLAQDFKTIAPYTIEEAYEVADAIDRGDMNDLRDELGDLLLQVVYHAQMAFEARHFNFDDVVAGVTAKMIHRHPHVFGDGKAATTEDVNVLWEQRKDKESKRQKAESILDDVPTALPAIKRAQKLQNRAARVGFEWPEVSQVLDKMEEEIAEMREALAGGKKDEILDELGDLFFVLTNFGRMLGTDCEEALRHANNKFTRRFKGVEIALKTQGIKLGDATLEQMEELWVAEKKKEWA
ncbi:MAG TPA: nucleoside triphosphate pyrophosphohydrolase [Alphaproteobacteria bacterium]